MTLRSAKAGLVVVRANKDGRRIGQSRACVTARQRMTCVSAALYVKGKRRAVRRLRVGG